MNAALPMPAPFPSVEVLRPLLPTAEDIFPYLKQIDANRWYTNFGPLERGLRTRLAKHFGITVEESITASNATSGMIAVLRALGVPRDSYCLVPAWTFVATPAAAIAAEMIPYFLDVKEETWALDPEQVKAQLRNIKGVIGAVMVVAPFGKPVDIAAWDRFTAETSIPVVIDAASGFDCFRNVRFGKTAVVISMHATKVLGVGEGAVVISADTGLIRHVWEQTNFGYYTRRIAIPGINSKMSEYVAAVAHAALDVWPTRRAQWLATMAACRKVLDPVIEKHHLKLWFPEDAVTTTCNVLLSAPIADSVISQLQVRGIKARQWWDKGCYVQPAYMKYPVTDLTVTKKLGASMVSLPFYIDIPHDQLAYVAAALDEVLST